MRGAAGRRTFPVRSFRPAGRRFAGTIQSALSDVCRPEPALGLVTPRFGRSVGGQRVEGECGTGPRAGHQGSGRVGRR